MTLAAAFDLAEQTGQAQTVDHAEHRLRIRVRISEYGERQLALAGTGGVSEAVAVAIAVEAGFGRWTTDRVGAALILTEVEAGEETEAPVTEAPANLTLFPPDPYRPGQPYPDFGPVHINTLYHALTPAGQLYTVIRYDRIYTGYRCDELGTCVTEADQRYHEHFEVWRDSL
jgi:hypothetical protein